jgi:hypothetical protein
MYVRNKKWNNRMYWQLIIGSKTDLEALAKHGETLPKVITLPRAIFLSSPIKNDDGEMYPSGTVEVRGWYPMIEERVNTFGGGNAFGKPPKVETIIHPGLAFVKPADPDYLLGVVEAAAGYHFARSKEGLGTKRDKLNYRAYLRVEKARKQLRQLYLCQYLANEESFREVKNELSEQKDWSLQERREMERTIVNSRKDSEKRTLEKIRKLDGPVPS